MSQGTLIKCSCCQQPTHSTRLKMDDELKSYVCPICRRNLHIAAAALEESGIKGVHRGPYSGNSNG